MAEYNMPQYILREFKVTDARVSLGDGLLGRIRTQAGPCRLLSVPLVIWRGLP